MSKTCLVCKIHHLEMINIFRHPEKLNSMLMLHWGLQASKDDFICRDCCDEVIHAFDLNQKCQLSNSQVVIRDGKMLNDQMNSVDPAEIEIVPIYGKMKAEPRSDDDFESKPNIFTANVKTEKLCGNMEETREAITDEYQIKIESLDGSSKQNGGNRSEGYLQYYKKEIPFDDGDSDEMKENPIVFSANRKCFITSTKLETNQKDFTGERPYECSLCSKTFITSTRLKEHKRTHTGERPFACSYCSKTYITAASLHIHIRTHMEEKPFVCSECGKSCTTSQLLKYHKRTHTGERPYACSYCSKSYITNGRLQRHMCSHSKEKHKGPYECVQCLKSFKSSWALKVHIRMHTQEINAFDSNQNSKQSNVHKIKVESREAEISNDATDPINRSVAAISSMDTKVKIELQSDDESEEDIEILPVKSESKKLSEQLLADENVENVSEEQSSTEFTGVKKSFKRDRSRSFNISGSADENGANSGKMKIIKTEFNSEFKVEQQTTYNENMLGDLSQKSSIKTHTKEKLFSCVECGKSFLTTTKLEIHKRTHTGERPYECLLCQKTFVSSYKLTEHNRIHIGDKPYECRYCSKSFLRSTELQGHERTHTKEKPYHCSECGKDFVTSSVLNRHKRIHTGVKPYVCSHCSKTFTSKFYLQTHIRSHTKENLFECSECGKSFTTSKLFKDHKMIHTGERPYSCNYCSKTYINRSGLINHTRSHTKENRKRKGPFECLQCSKTFRNSCAYKVHALTHAKEKNSSDSNKELKDEGEYFNTKSGTARSEESVEKDSKFETLVPDSGQNVGCISEDSQDEKVKIVKKEMSVEIEDKSNDNEEKGKSKALKIHTGEKSYNCYHCTKILYSSRNLRIHMRIHKKDKPYGCFECGQNFISSSDLKRHKRTHTRKKLYACSYCSKTYSRIGHWQKHMLVHMREQNNIEKPYECDQSSKTFENGSAHKVPPQKSEALRDDRTVLNEKIVPADQMKISTIKLSDNNLENDFLREETEIT